MKTNLAQTKAQLIDRILGKKTSTGPIFHELAEPDALPLVFHCTHRVYGVGMIDTSAVVEADRTIGEAAENAPATFLADGRLVYLGRISYPLYLVHYPVFATFGLIALPLALASRRAVAAPQLRRGDRGLRQAAQSAPDLRRRFPRRARQRP